MNILFFLTQNISGGKIMIIANIISYALVVIGALNWGLVGIFNWNLVEAIFGGYNAGSIIVYILVAISAIWLLVSPMLTKGRLYLCDKEKYTM